MILKKIILIVVYLLVLEINYNHILVLYLKKVHIGYKVIKKDNVQL